MTDDEVQGRKAHVYRTVPPWRQSPPLTQCGLDPEGRWVLTIEEADAKWKREGSTRAAYTFCMTCTSRARSYSGAWNSWQEDPVRLIDRDEGGPHAGLAKRELHALAALAAAHPDQFAQLLAAGNDLETRRQQRGRGRTR